MIDHTLFLQIFLGFAALYLIIGLIASRKVNTIKSYFLADKGLGGFQLTLSLIATHIGSAMIIGTAERGYSIGLLGILYAASISIGLLILGFGLAAKMRSLNVATTAQIFETRYNSPALKMIASALSIASLWGILVGQIIASHTLLTTIGITEPWVPIFFWSVLIVYAMMGGLVSVALVNSIQIIFIIGTFVYLKMIALPAGGGILLDTKLLAKMQSFYFFKKIDWSVYLPTLVMPALFSLIEQDLAQKFFAAKTKITATASALMASIIIIIFSMIPLMFGIFARIQNMQIPAGETPLLHVIATKAAGLPLILAICAITAAITSTADSLLCAISSHIVQDFFTFNSSEKVKMWLSRGTTLVIGASAFITSLYVQGDIILVMEHSYRLSIACLLIPTIIAYFKKKLHPFTAWVSVSAGFLGLVWAYLKLPYSIERDLLPLTLSLAGFIIAHVLVDLYQALFKKNKKSHE